MATAAERQASPAVDEDVQMIFGLSESTDTTTDTATGTETSEEVAPTPFDFPELLPNTSTTTKTRPQFGEGSSWQQLHYRGWTPPEGFVWKGGLAAPLPAWTNGPNPLSKRNQIVLKRLNFHSDAKRFERVSDALLFYSKTDTGFALKVCLESKVGQLRDFWCKARR